MLHRGDDDGAIARAPSSNEAAPKFDGCKRRDAEGQPEGHWLRSCWIGMHVGEAMGMDRQQPAKPGLPDQVRR